MTAVASTSLVGLAAPASAQPSVVHFGFNDSGSLVEPDFCGIEVDIAWTESGRTSVRPVRGSDGEAYFGHTNFELTEVISTPAGSVRVITKSVFHEQRATHVSGDIWQFQWLDAGTFRLFGDDDTLLLRGNGVFKATQQFDTLGDGQPGGHPVSESMTVLHERGQTIDNEAFCEAAIPYLT